MKALLVFFLIYGLSINYLHSNQSIKIAGETSYTSATTNDLESTLVFEYHFLLYEPRHKKWGIHLSGKVAPLYDLFGNEIKMDVFTVIGINF